MTRTHSYRFNPKTNVGEWTNIGANTLSCEAKDSSFLGDNSLDVDLVLRSLRDEMSVLTENLSRLEEWLRRSDDAPTWTGARFVESRNIQYGRTDTILMSTLRTVEAFEPRFEALLQAGYAWINLSALGVLGGELLVSVEVPRDTSSVPYGRTSVNLSGPPLDSKTGARVWDASLRTRLVEDGASCPIT